jgi:peptidoglycan hydrolase CwlO-like protein
MKTENKIKGIAVAVTVLFFFSLITAVYFYNDNGTLNDYLSQAKLKSEKLLSEKLLLDKNIAALKKDLSSLKGLNTNLDQRIASMQKSLTERESRISQLNKDKASYVALKKEYSEIQKIRESLAAQLESLVSKNNSLAMENSQLNRKISDIQNENALMLAELSQLRVLRDGPEGFMVEIEKKKADKLTVRATKAKRVNVSFEIPEDLKGLPSAYTIEIQSEQGKKLNGVANITSNSVRSGLVANSGNAPAEIGRQRVNIEFVPQEKLTKGIYTFNIYRNGDLVARAKARLSK